MLEEKWGNDSLFEITNSDISNLGEIKFESKNCPEEALFHVSIVFRTSEHKNNMVFCFCDENGKILGSDEFLGVNED